MQNNEMILELLQHIEDALKLITVQTEAYQSADDFLNNPKDTLILDGVCMNLIAIGEAVKKLDKLSAGTLLIKYPNIPWKDIMKTRDIIAHHYFDVDAERVFIILRNDIPPLLKTIQQIQKDNKF